MAREGGLFEVHGWEGAIEILVRSVFPRPGPEIDPETGRPVDWSRRNAMGEPLDDPNNNVVESDWYHLSLFGDPNGYIKAPPSSTFFDDVSRDTFEKCTQENTNTGWSRDGCRIIRRHPGLEDPGISTLRVSGLELLRSGYDVAAGGSGSAGGPCNLGEHCPSGKTSYQIDASTKPVFVKVEELVSTRPQALQVLDEHNRKPVVEFLDNQNRNSTILNDAQTRELKVETIKQLNEQRGQISDRPYMQRKTVVELVSLKDISEKS
jgi:hypothetical protein